MRSLTREGHPTTAIDARIAELINTEATLKTVQGELAGNQDQTHMGKKPKLANVQSELKETKDSLQVYKDAEQKAREAEILVVVDAAIEAGKIEASAKDA